MRLSGQCLVQQTFWQAPSQLLHCGYDIREFYVVASAIR